MGGVNHCSLHCRLAKFRGLMYRGKCGAVIGRKPHFFVCAQHKFPGYGFFQANHSAVFPPVLYVKSRNFAKRQCKLPVQWLTPPITRNFPKTRARAELFMFFRAGASNHLLHLGYHPLRSTCSSINLVSS
jgi:hypothetical protein